MLHSDDPTISLSIGMDIQVAKDTKESDPEDEENQIPDEEEWNARYEGNEVDDGGDSGEGGSDFGVDLGMLARLVEGKLSQERKGSKRTHFPSLYLCSLFARCRSTP
jgi:hypothetical protein